MKIENIKSTATEDTLAHLLEFHSSECPVVLDGRRTQDYLSLGLATGGSRVLKWARFDSIYLFIYFSLRIWAFQVCTLRYFTLMFFCHE